MTHQIGKAIELIRTGQGLSQREFADRLEVTPAYISALESCRQIPSKMFLKLLSYEFGVSLDWLNSGAGTPFTDPKKNENLKIVAAKEKTNDKKASANLLVLASILCPVLPTAAAALAVGVGAAEVIEKMRKAYGAKSTAELATNHFEVDRTYLSHWIRKNHIPTKYVEKAVMETKLPLEYFLTKDGVIEAGIREIVKFTKDQILEYKKNEFDLGALETRFKGTFNLTS